jgi:hypothetical protein
MEIDLRRIDPKSVRSFECMSLSDFVTERSLNLFVALRIDPGIVTSQDDPVLWQQSPAYIKCKGKGVCIACRNDCAERAIKLATDLNMALSHDETQPQLILQVYLKKELYN